MINGLETKYYVIKRDDVKYLTKEQQNQLEKILMDIFYARIEDKKKDNQYIVINTDEPYIGKVIELMKEHGQLQ